MDKCEIREFYRLSFFYCSHADIPVLDFIFLYISQCPIRFLKLYFLLTKIRKQGCCNINNKAAHFPFEEQSFFKNKLYDICKKLCLLRNYGYFLACQYSTIVMIFNKPERLFHEQRRNMWGSSQNLCNYTDLQELQKWCGNCTVWQQLHFHICLACDWNKVILGEAQSHYCNQKILISQGHQGKKMLGRLKMGKFFQQVNFQKINS